MNRRPLLVLALALAAGCTVGKDYQRPEVAVARSFASPATQPATHSAVSPADDRWWRTLNDPILDDLIARATKANLDVKIAAAHIAQARAYEKATAAMQYPQINVGASYSNTQLSHNAAPYNAFSVPGFPWNFDTYSAGFDAAWEADVFGRTRRATQAAKGQIDVTVEEQRGVLLSVLAEVARNYVELRGYQRGLEIAQQNLKLQEQTLELTRDRRAKGIAIELDVARARAQVETTRAIIPTLQTMQWQSLYRIALLLNEELDPVVAQLQEHKPIPVPPARIDAGIPADLLRRRPDIRRAERDVAVASAQVGVATADLYPKFFIGGNFGLASSEPKTFFRGNSVTWGITPGVTWPIFDGGRLDAIVKANQAKQQETVVAYELTIRRAITEVRDALVAFSQEQDRRQSLVNAVQANSEAVDMAQQLYDRGMTDFLSVLDAQRNLYTTQEALVRSELAESALLIASYKALGGGWQSALPEAPATQPAVAQR